MIDMNGAILGVTRDDLTDINISIEPVTVDVDGHLAATGVYELHTSPSNADVEAKYLGRLCFHLEDKYEWEYDGDQLSDDEVEQVVTFIQEEREENFFSRPKKTDLQRLEVSLFHAFKTYFVEDPTGASPISYNGIPVKPLYDNVELDEFFKKVVTFYSTL
jgi:hypothetical protein